MENKGEGECLDVSPKETGRVVRSTPSAQCQRKGLEEGCGGMDGCKESQEG